MYKKIGALLIVALMVFSGCEGTMEDSMVPLDGTEAIIDDTNTYIKYENEKFGYIVYYPDLFTQTEKREDGCGLDLTNDEKDAALFIWGEDAGDKAAADYLDEVKKGKANLTHTYADDYFFNLRYTDSDDGSINFYQCGFVNNGMAVQFTVSFREKDRDNFENIISHMSVNLVNINYRNKEKPDSGMI